MDDEASIPPPDTVNPWAEIVGPCYTTSSIGRLLGLSEREVSDAAASLQLLALRTSDGMTLYPAFQIWDGQVVEGLAEVLQVLRTGIDDSWTWAQWLNTAVSDGDAAPTRAIDELRAGHLAAVIRDAAYDAAVWRS